MSNIQQLIVLDKTVIESKIENLRKYNGNGVENTACSIVANELVELLQQSKPLEPIVSEAFRQGSNVPSFEDDSIAESSERYNQLKQHYLKTFNL